MTKLNLIIVAAVLGALPLVAADKEDSVEALIARGLKAYKEGKSQEAIAALQAAIGAIQKSQEKDLARFIPAAPEGWEAGEIEAASTAGTIGKESSATTNVERKYTKKGADGLRATVSLITMKELVEAQRTIAETYRKNPEILKAMQTADTQISVIDQDGWIGWRVINKKGDAQVHAFCKSCMLQVQVDKCDEKALETFFKAIDLKGLAGVLPAAPAEDPNK